MDKNLTGATLRRLREQGGMTRENLAELASVSIGTIKNYERGRIPIQVVMWERLLTILQPRKNVGESS